MKMQDFVYWRYKGFHTNEILKKSAFFRITSQNKMLFFLMNIQWRRHILTVCQNGIDYSCRTCEVSSFNLLSSRILLYKCVEFLTCRAEVLLLLCWSFIDYHVYSLDQVLRYLCMKFVPPSHFFKFYFYYLGEPALVHRILNIKYEL